jgi:hypothetical protein
MMERFDYIKLPLEFPFLLDDTRTLMWDRAAMGIAGAEMSTPQLGP